MSDDNRAKKNKKKKTKAKKKTKRAASAPPATDGEPPATATGGESPAASVEAILQRIALTQDATAASSAGGVGIPRSMPPPGEAPAGVLRPVPRNEDVQPLVTVIGAGIAGLSAAHELIERGFRVVVVEKAKSEDVEHACEVGGIAATQMTRIPFYEEGPATVVSGSLGADSKMAPLDLTFEELRTVAERTGLSLAFSCTPAEVGKVAAGLRGMRPTQKRFGLPHVLVFEDDGSDEESWKEVPDRCGRTNQDKLAEIAGTIRKAYDTYYADLVELVPGLAGTSFDPSTRPEDAHLVLRVEVLAYTDDDAPEGKSRELAGRLARRVKYAIGAELMGHDDQGVDGDGARPDITNCLVERPMGSAHANGVAVPTQLPDPWKGWVMFRIDERLMPGEHGYRYFPAFYRHLFDTMRRTPIIDERGRVTSETAFDHLVPAPHVALAFRGRPDEEGAGDGRTCEFPRRRAATAKELRKILELTFDDMGVTERDLLHYQMELLRYATSCTARRCAYEEVSWWDFVRGRNDASQPPIVDGDRSDPRNRIYSGRMTRWIREIPQALAAMEAAETDARTYGTVTVQLLYDDLGTGERSDRTLDGPTSPAWLRYWKRYLKRQGVQFCQGEVESLELQTVAAPAGASEGATEAVSTERRVELVPIFKEELVHEPNEGQPEEIDPWLREVQTRGLRKRTDAPEGLRPEDADFFILAVPLTAAVKLVAGITREKTKEKETDDTREAETCLAETELTELECELVTELERKLSLRPGQRVQAKPALLGRWGDLLKILYFAREADIPFDPAAIAKPRRDESGRPVFPLRYPLRDLVGVQFFFPNNVRIGHGHVYYADAEWGLSSISQVAHWRDRPGGRSPFLGQISVDVGDMYATYMDADGRERIACRSTRHEIAECVWDQIRASTTRTRRDFLPMPAYYHVDAGIADPPQGDFIVNCTPFLLNLPGQWTLRPGLYAPSRKALGGDVRVWERFYEEAYERVRLEARPIRPIYHRPSAEIFYRVAFDRWVLAGAHMATYTRLNTMEAANESARHAVNAILHRLVEVHDDPAERALYNSGGKLVADECEIWNPEEHEWDDLEPLKRLDEALYAEGLPHFLDILRVPEWIARVPHRKRDAKRPLYGLLRLVELSRSTAMKEWESTLRGLEGMGEELEARLRELQKRYGLDL